MRLAIYLLTLVSTSVVSGEQYISWATNTSAHTCYTASNVSPHHNLNVSINLYDINGLIFSGVNPKHTINNATLGSTFIIEPLKSARVCTSNGSFNKGFGIVKSWLNSDNAINQMPLLTLNGHYYDWSTSSFSLIPVNNSQPF